MLKENFFISASDEIIELYNQYTDSIIKRMAYEIKQLGELDDIERKAKLVMSANTIYNDMIEKLATLTKYSKQDINTILKLAGVKTLEYDDKIYERAGLKPAPINQSPQLLQIMASVGRTTNFRLENLVRTSALSTSNFFYETLNEAFLHVSTGHLDYNTAIMDAILKLATYGTIIEYPTGWKNQLDTVVRRAVLTSIKDTANALQVSRAEEFDAPYADTSAHSGARPGHAEWQGKRFCLKGSKLKGTGKYLNFYEDNFGSENKPVFEQLQDPNCRHSWYPVMFDDEKRAYSAKEIQELNKAKVTDNDGNEYTIYEAEQKLRQMERTVRKYKRQVNALKIAGLDYKLKEAKVEKWDREILWFVRATGIQRREFNEQVFY